jgi:hypothetical protein
VEKSWCGFYTQVREALHKHYGDKLYEDKHGCSIAMDAGQFEVFLSCRDLNAQLCALMDMFTDFNRVIEPCL